MQPHVPGWGHFCEDQGTKVQLENQLLACTLSFPQALAQPEGPSSSLGAAAALPATGARGGPTPPACHAAPCHSPRCALAVFIYSIYTLIAFFLHGAKAELSVSPVH